jgi:1-deoxy-D-xylulose-5-phosphate synthase
LAAGGRRPVVAIYSTFLQRAFDQVVHDVAVQRLPVVFAVDRAGLVGEDGATHHGVFDMGYLRAVPDIVIACPRDENQLTHLLYTALRHEKGPFVVRYPRGAAVGVPIDSEPREIPVGTWEALTPYVSGDVALLATGATVQTARAAGALLEERGYRVAIVDGRFVKPVDESMLARLMEECELVVTIEDHALATGFGSAVLEAVETMGLSGARVHRIGLGDHFVEHGSRAVLLEAAGLAPRAVADRVAGLLARPAAVGTPSAR